MNTEIEKINTAKKIIAQATTQATTHLNEGKALYAAENYNDAEKAYQTGLKLLNDLGISNRIKEELTEEMEQITVVKIQQKIRDKQTSQKYKKAHDTKILGDKEYKDNNYEEALAIYTQWLDIEGKLEGMPKEFIDMLEGKKKKAEEAITATDALVKGEEAYKVGDYDRAKQIFEAGSAIDGIPQVLIDKLMIEIKKSDVRKKRKIKGEAATRIGALARGHQERKKQVEQQQQQAAATRIGAVARGRQSRTLVEPQLSKHIAEQITEQIAKEKTVMKDIEWRLDSTHSETLTFVALGNCRESDTTVEVSPYIAQIEEIEDRIRGSTEKGLREELKQLKQKELVELPKLQPSKLTKKAREYGVSDEAIDESADADDPREALITLVVAAMPADFLDETKDELKDRLVQNLKLDEKKQEVTYRFNIAKAAHVPLWEKKLRGLKAESMGKGDRLMGESKYAEAITAYQTGIDNLDMPESEKTQLSKKIEGCHNKLYLEGVKLLEADNYKGARDKFDQIDADKLLFFRIQFEQYKKEVNAKLLEQKTNATQSQPTTPPLTSMPDINEAQKRGRELAIEQEKIRVQIKAQTKAEELLKMGSMGLGSSSKLKEIDQAIRDFGEALEMLKSYSDEDTVGLRKQINKKKIYATQLRTEKLTEPTKAEKNQVRIQQRQERFQQQYEAVVRLAKSPIYLHLVIKNCDKILKELESLNDISAVESKLKMDTYLRKFEAHIATAKKLQRERKYEKAIKECKQVMNIEGSPDSVTLKATANALEMELEASWATLPKRQKQIDKTQTKRQKQIDKTQTKINRTKAKEDLTNEQNTYLKSWASQKAAEKLRIKEAKTDKAAEKLRKEKENKATKKEANATKKEAKATKKNASAPGNKGKTPTLVKPAAPTQKALTKTAVPQMTSIKASVAPTSVAPTSVALTPVALKAKAAPQSSATKPPMDSNQDNELW